MMTIDITSMPLVPVPSWATPVVWASAPSAGPFPISSIPVAISAISSVSSIISSASPSTIPLVTATTAPPVSISSNTCPSTITIIASTTPPSRWSLTISTRRTIIRWRTAICRTPVAWTTSRVVLRSTWWRATSPRWPTIGTTRRTPPVPIWITSSTSSIIFPITHPTGTTTVVTSARITPIPIPVTAHPISVIMPISVSIAVSIATRPGIVLCL
mmetsp:Transcript_33465/g.49890  ORF Transcript_33465/g.49890 Transcript_33465/m.49890 type:complete len:215 (+) Transcript_33465:78-722(+)